ncbi:unnamed protein product [Phytophthora lilii]|uniref:Unnamed protein product n=1 Tax=Phytophthora lilii TaxID=2077276 RepID=A0A9W6YJR0_9STRA|nr:unnamed protein product [Phytophthora lilii]
MDADEAEVEVAIAGTVEGAKATTCKTWLLDSGASCHMTDERDDFDDFRELAAPITITVASGEPLDAEARGTVRFTLQNGSTVTLTDVLYVPMLDRRLVSVAALTARGVLVQFEHGKATLMLNGNAVAVIRKEGKLFAWNVQQEGYEEAHEAVVQRMSESDNALWHARLGHVSYTKLKLIRAACDGVPEPPRQDDGICGGCARGKMSTSPFAHRSGSEVKTYQPFEIVHSDVMGPIKPVSKGGARYMLTFIDDFTRFVHIYLISSKAVVFDKFEEYFALVGTQYGRRQNGLAERMNRTITEMARSMLHSMQIERKWWGEAIMTAVHLVNRIPNSARPGVSPLEVLTGSKPVLDYLRVFGAKGFVHIDEVKWTKLDAKAHRCLFLGYAETSKAYRVWDLDDNKRLVTSRSVVLDERAASGYREVILDDGRVNNNKVVSTFDEDDMNMQRTRDDTPSTPSTEAMEIDETAEDQAADMEVDPIEPRELQVVSAAVPIEGERREIHGIETPAIMPQQLTLSLEFSTLRTKKQRWFPPQTTRHFADTSGDRLVFSGGSTKPQSLSYSALRLLTNGDDPDSESGVPLLTDAPATTAQSDSDTDEPKPKRQRVDEYEIALAATDVPQSYAEAMAAPEFQQWKEAIRREIRAHIRNHTWDVVRRPPGVKVIGFKWVFAHKFDETGQIVRYKARLVALGYLQTPGIDYFNTYSPVASRNTIRVFLAVCCNLGLIICQFDVETAFLNGDLEEDVYMAPPLGIDIPEGMVCKLRRSLYGLKQAAAVWFKKIRSVFISMGFMQCRADPCLFVSGTKLDETPPRYLSFCTWTTF